MSREVIMDDCFRAQNDAILALLASRRTGARSEMFVKMKMVERCGRAYEPSHTQRQKDGPDAPEPRCC
jgi:hypothetical protein